MKCSPPKNSDLVISHCIFTMQPPSHTFFYLNMVYSISDLRLVSDPHHDRLGLRSQSECKDFGVHWKDFISSVRKSAISQLIKMPQTLDMPEIHGTYDLGSGRRGAISSRRRESHIDRVNRLHRQGDKHYRRDRRRSN